MIKHFFNSETPWNQQGIYFHHSVCLTNGVSFSVKSESSKIFVKYEIGAAFHMVSKSAAQQTYLWGG